MSTTDCYGAARHDALTTSPPTHHVLYYYPPLQFTVVCLLDISYPPYSNVLRPPYWGFTLSHHSPKCAGQVIPVQPLDLQCQHPTISTVIQHGRGVSSGVGVGWCGVHTSRTSKVVMYKSSNLSSATQSYTGHRQNSVSSDTSCAPCKKRNQVQKGQADPPERLTSPLLCGGVHPYELRYAEITPAPRSRG